ncbi:hypothetical protein E2C04_01050 [Nocardioides daphniae]|uniref:Uncharacterized protein n=1 Tax=Nocardioides daphniae TaxID=402297 RepID=A0A4P7UA13_9ACTN|nr:hypothetical protein E2C04_01050 [Nocardioides daphniae]
MPHVTTWPVTGWSYISRYLASMICFCSRSRNCSLPASTRAGSPEWMSFHDSYVARSSAPDSYSSLIAFMPPWR